MTSDNKKRQRGAGAASPKMETVAQIAGVSMMTVSRVLNGKSNVRPATRRKVEETIRAVGYTPNASARSLALAESPYIGLAYLNPSSGYLGQFLIGALDSARRLGLHIVLEPFGTRASDWPEELLAFSKKSRLRGLILPPPLCDDEKVLIAAREIGLPVIRVSPSNHDESCISVRIDEYRASFEMTELLLSHGHRLIGFLKGPLNQGATAQRFQGFAHAMSQGGQSINPDWIAEGDFAVGPALQAGLRILREKNRPTAIFASNDDMAAGVYAAAQQLGLTVPGDISIVGFDNQPIATSLWPNLTTVHQPIANMAFRAVELLSNPRNGINSRTERDYVFPFDIIVRDSVARPS